MALYGDYGKVKINILINPVAKSSGRIQYYMRFPRFKPCYILNFKAYTWFVLSIARKNTYIWIADAPFLSTFT